MSDNPVVRVLGPVVRLTGLAAGYGVLILSFVVAAEVVLRRTVGVSLQGADEFGGYVLAALAAFGFAFALMERAHTRIELLHERLGPTPRAALDVLAMLAVAGMAAFMAARGVAVVAESLEYGSLSGTPSMTPLWRPQAVWAAGLVLFAVFSIACAAHALWLLFRDPGAIQAQYGAKSLDEEIAEEQRAVENRSAAR
jgi:TRAP-type mannitol/chloroaromatic compound transport system permease small subunit